MDIYSDIERATHIPFVNDNTLFVRTRRPRNPRRGFRPVRNTELLEDDSRQMSTAEFRNIMQDRFLNANEISASIRMANGGLSYSNQDMEEYWKAEQAKASATLDNSSNTPSDGSQCSLNEPSLKQTDNVRCDSETNVEDNRADNAEAQTTETVSEEEVLRICKLSKNAAIKGLIRNQIISIENLDIPNQATNESAACSQNAGSSKVSSTFQNENAQLVPLPEDPDILVTPLEAYGTIDVSKHKDLDFTVDRLGKKTVITPQQYYIYEVDDSMFNFVKKDPKPTQ